MDISRSEIVTISECEEKAYATYREDSTGYVPAGADSNITALQGSALHKGGEILFTQGPTGPWREAIHDELAGLPEPHRKIRTTLIRRAMLGWILKRYPQIISEWKPLGAEVPWKWELAPGIHQPLRMDDLMEHRSHGGIGIFDFKTAGAPDLNWKLRKEHSKQTHLYVKALQDVTRASGKFVSGMMYDCIEIGKWDSKRELMKSRFTTGYRSKGGNTISPKWSYGATVVNLCEWTDDQWLEWIEAHKGLNDCYWTTGLILPPSESLERTQSATIVKVQNWQIKLNVVKNSLDRRLEANIQFDRNPDACLTYGWELKCPFYYRCWKGSKLDAKTFEPRKNHHEPTID